MDNWILFFITQYNILGFTSVYPALYSFVLSFYNWNWGTQQDFVGLSNEVSFAVALGRRVREILVGLPAIITWSLLSKKFKN